jgi:hypothetical protein
MLRRSPRRSGKVGRDQPSGGCRGGIQCINELFGFAQEALAQQALTRRETGLALDGVSAAHAAYFEEMAAHQETGPTEADQSELSDDDAPPTWRDPAPETRVGV